MSDTPKPSDGFDDVLAKGAAWTYTISEDRQKVFVTGARWQYAKDSERIETLASTNRLIQMDLDSKAKRIADLESKLAECEKKVNRYARLTAKYVENLNTERAHNLESKLAIAITALEEIGRKTYTDPAGEVELRARAAYVYKLYREVLEKLK